jgi:hypothetical protein
MNRGHSAACIYTISNFSCTSACKQAARLLWCSNSAVGIHQNDLSGFVSIRWDGECVCLKFALRYQTLARRLPYVYSGRRPHFRGPITQVKW